jgi:predicted ester cyclase
MSDSAESERVVRAWNDAYSRKDVDQTLTYMADDLERKGEWSDGWITIDKETWGISMRAFFAAFPDWGWEMTTLVAAGDMVACEFFEHGTFTQPYDLLPGLVIQPTGDSYEDRDGVFLRVNDDSLIAEIHAYVTKDLFRKFGFETAIAEFLAQG